MTDLLSGDLRRKYADLVTIPYLPQMRPPVPLSHISRDLGAFRVKFDRHSEFARYKFIAPDDGGASPQGSRLPHRPLLPHREEGGRREPLPEAADGRTRGRR